MRHPRVSLRRKAALPRAIQATLWSALASAALVSPAAMAQDADATPSVGNDPITLDQVVVTGSRIRRSDPETSAPLVSISEQTMTDRGFVQVGDALNDMTAVLPDRPQTAGGGSSSGSGLMYPNLFGMGAGRTLSLVNGRRFVASGNGMEGNMVDANMIPTGLLQSVEIVQGGGAAVYGSDAIAGVVNYVLKENYEGLNVDFQAGISSKHDYKTNRYRLTWGSNFADGRGNIALNLEQSSSDPLDGNSREAYARSRVTSNNPANTGPDDGIPAVMEVIPATFWAFNNGGVVFTSPGPLPNFLARKDGQALQFDSNGNVVNYDTGNILGIPFAEGGEGLKYSDQASLFSGVERQNANLIGHLWLTDRVKLSTELFYGKTKARDLLGSMPSRTVLYGNGHDNGPIMFTRNNPFLTAQAISTLSAASPAFAAGAPMWLSKNFVDLIPSRESIYEGKTWRALAALDGDFDIGERTYYWSVAASHAENEYSTRRWGVHMGRFNKAINAVRNASGSIVCGVNAVTVTDADCLPLNPFAAIDPAVAEYVSDIYGSTSHSQQRNVLATLGGDLFELPAGPVQFSAAYEWRGEQATFSPTAASAAGSGQSGVPELAQTGKYDTNEISLEVVVPLVSQRNELPFVKHLELNTALRYVDHSTAGSDEIWSIGGRWQITDGFTVRGSRSRNFRAPTMAQLYSPITHGFSASLVDPCDADRIDQGPDAATRRANCVAEWAANPGYAPLATFQSLTENTVTVPTVSGGNPNLKSEVAYTSTWGFVWQPQYIDGLSVIVDRVEVKLLNGLSQLVLRDFMAACYDAKEQSDSVCGTFERDSAGQVIRGTSQYFNAGWMEFKGETYAVQYDLPLSKWASADIGNLQLGLEGTRYEKLAYSVTGFDITRSEGTVPGSDLNGAPSWSARLDARYSLGPVRASWSVNHLPRAKHSYYATIETNPNPWVHSNTRHNVSLQYSFNEKLTVRAGVDNLFDAEPSYPSSNYGDIIGRYGYVGFNVKF